jgi:hypothetical protein
MQAPSSSISLIQKDFLWGFLSLGCFRAFDTPTYVHQRHITGGGRASVGNPEFNWVNTLLGNVKNPITGTYHAICGQHAPRYLAAELEYRFNRRYDLKAMIPRFLTAAARTPPMPYRFLRMAELYA